MALRAVKGKKLKVKGASFAKATEDRLTISRIEILSPLYFRLSPETKNTPTGMVT